MKEGYLIANFTLNTKELYIRTREFIYMKGVEQIDSEYERKERNKVSFWEAWKFLNFNGSQFWRNPFAHKVSGGRFWRQSIFLILQVSYIVVGQSMLDVSDNFVPWEYGDGIHSSHTIMSLVNKIHGKIYYSCEMKEYYIVILWEY